MASTQQLMVSPPITSEWYRGGALDRRAAANHG